jgi:hypothetical protein
MSPSDREVFRLGPLQDLVQIRKGFPSDGMPNNHRPYHVQGTIVAIRMRPWRHIRLQDVLPSPPGVPPDPACQAERTSART